MHQSTPGEEDRAILQEIENVFVEFDRIVDNWFDKLPVLPDSDIAKDNRLIPDWPVAFLSFDLLGSAVDHFNTLRLSSGTHDDDPDRMIYWHARSPWTLLRAAVECASQTIWMLCENDPDVRMRRYLRTWYDERSNFYQARILTVPPAERGGLQLIEDWDVQEFTPRVAAWDSGEKPGKLRAKPIFRDCVRMAAEYVQAVRPDDAELLWRVASGYAHGRAWASQETGKIRVIDVPEGQLASQSTVDHEHLCKMIAFTALTIEYADWLVKERMGHEIVAFKPFMEMRPAS